MSLIIDTITAYLPLKKKVTPSKWISFNSVCCIHNGTTADTRHRGGVFLTPENGIIYHCFNCQFKASWYPGRPLSPKVKKLLAWLNVPDDIINKCVFESLRLKDEAVENKYQTLIPTFFSAPLPQGARPVIDWINESNKVRPIVEYIYNRGFTVDSYNWYWSDQKGFNNRLIIPYYYRGNIVGYTARTIINEKPKYISEQQAGFVFNLDRQTEERKFVIVCEGQLDAISIDGVAFMANELSNGQSFLIQQLNREIIVVPDRDHDGPRIVKQAIELGWSVSFPEWREGIKDINDAVKEYGRLYTLYNILENKESSGLKIQLKARRWFK